MINFASAPAISPTMIQARIPISSILPQQASNDSYQLRIDSQTSFHCWFFFGVTLERVRGCLLPGEQDKGFFEGLFGG